MSPFVVVKVIVNCWNWNNCEGDVLIFKIIGLIKFGWLLAVGIKLEELLW